MLVQVEIDCLLEVLRVFLPGLIPLHKLVDLDTLEGTNLVDMVL